MNIHITYRPFCKVDLWHGYYLHPADFPGNELDVYNSDPDIPDQKQIIESESKRYSIEQDLSFSPARSCLRYLEDLKMRFRQESSGFSIWIRAKKLKEQGGQIYYEPFVPLDQDFKIVVPVRLRNSAFVNFTNVGLNTPRHFVYYFSNKAGNVHHTPLFLFLNAPEAPNQYISEADRLPLYSSVRNIDVQPYDLKHIRFEVIAKDQPAHRYTVSFTAEASQDRLTECQLFFRDLPTGVCEQKAYTLISGTEQEVTELRETFYHNKGNILKGTFGIIELFHLADGSLGDYRLLDNQGALTSPIYTLWWQNRLTKWRYLFNTEQPAPDKNVSDVEFEDADKTILITKAEQPLLQKKQKVRYQADIPGNTEEFALPNPGSEQLYPDVDSSPIEIYAELNMGDINFNKI